MATSGYVPNIHHPEIETRITRGRRGVFQECHVCGERYAGAHAAQRRRVKPGAGEDSLRRQPLRAQERNRLAGQPGVDPPHHHGPLGSRHPRPFAGGDKVGLGTATQHKNDAAIMLHQF